MEKKTIKIKFVGAFRDYDQIDFLNVLNERYNVVLSETPDYIFYDVYDQEHLKYDCIRIFHTGECYTPDFNECDYALAYDRFVFGDRYVRIPLYNIHSYKENYRKLFNRKKFTIDDLRAKKNFCTFVVSNCFASDMRSIFFDRLSKYKTVLSGGRFKNNIGGAIKDKQKFLSDSKFNIAFENNSYSGYVTEKIMEAFAAYTIPIYYGDPEITKDFNSKAFVNVMDYDTIDDAIARIKEIDNDDNLYLQMINEPIVNPCVMMGNLKDFLYNIFDQPLEKAGRRPKNSLTAKRFEAIHKRHAFFEDHIYLYIQKAKNLCYRLKTGTMLSKKRTK